MSKGCIRAAFGDSEFTGGSQNARKFKQKKSVNLKKQISMITAHQSMNFSMCELGSRATTFSNGKLKFLDWIGNFREMSIMEAFKLFGRV